MLDTVVIVSCLSLVAGFLFGRWTGAMRATSLAPPPRTRVDVPVEPAATIRLAHLNGVRKVHPHHTVT